MRCNSKGFSLIGLMIVVSIVAVMIMISTVNLVSGLSQHRIKRAATELASNLRKARWKAIKQERMVRVVFDLDGDHYLVDGTPYPNTENFAEYYGGGVSYGFGRASRSATASGGSLPKSPVTFQGNPKRVSFNPHGLSNPGTVYFSNGEGDACAIVVNTAGRIRYRRWNGKKWY